MAEFLLVGEEERIRMSNQIQGVVHRQIDPKQSNTRAQRTLLAVFNGDSDLGGYVAAQVKLLILWKHDFLGRQGHYHEYPELYWVMPALYELFPEGQLRTAVCGILDLLGMNTPEVTFDLDNRSGQTERHILKPGEILLIPAGVAHRAYGKQGTVLLGSSGGPWRDGSDIAADFDPLGELPYGLS